MQAKRKLKYLEGIFLVYLFDRCRESSELVEGRMGIVRCVRSMTRAVGMLGDVDEPENGSARRGHGKSRVENYVLFRETLNLRRMILGDNKTIERQTMEGTQETSRGSLEPPHK